MKSRNSVISILMFSLSLALFVIFSLTIFFGGQEIGGAIYFIYIAVSLAFTFLSKRIRHNYMSLYRYSAYLADAFNILAAGSIIYYKVHVPYMVAIGSLVGISLIVDLIAKSRLEENKVVSILSGLLNCGLMCSIFPFFFISDFTLGFAIAGTVFAVFICALKILVAVVGETLDKKAYQQPAQTKQEQTLEEKITDTPDETIE